MRGRFIGRMDPPLTAAGRANAAAKLAALNVRTVFASPLRRALETAEQIRCGAELVVIPDLAEMDFGEWEGLLWSEIQARSPVWAGRKLDNWFAFAPPGGESWEAFRARLDRALERIQEGPFPAAVVAHMLVNAVLAERLLGAEPGQFFQKYGEILECPVVRYA
jgi:alpha-ribazole phosphatase